LGAVERSGDEPFVKGMPIVVSRPAYGDQPRHEAGAVGYDVRLELGTADRCGEIGRDLSSERAFLKVGPFVVRA